MADCAVRCNRKVPCDHCARSKGEACNYVLDDYPAGTGKSQRVAIDQTTRSPNTSPTTNGESPAYLVDLDLPGSGVFDARDTHFAVPSQPITRPMEDQSQVGRTDSTTTLEGPQSALAIEPLMDRVQHLEQRLSDAVKSQSSASATNSSPGPDMAMSIRGKFSKTRFFGQSHWMNGTDQVWYFTLRVSCQVESLILTAKLFAYRHVCIYIRARSLRYRDNALLSKVGNILYHLELRPSWCPSARR